MDEFLEALLENDAESAKKLLDAGTSVETEDEMGNTPLHNAVGIRNTEITKLLLEAGADPNAKNDKEQTPLHVAADEFAWEGDFADAALFDDQQLDLANSIACAEALIAAGADLEAEDEDGKTPLQLSMEGEAGVFNLLAKAGANLEAVERTSLHYAARFQPTEIVIMLVDNGADVKMRDDNNETALHLAAIGGKPETVKFLLERGADPNARAGAGKNAGKGYAPLHFADDPKIAKLLLDEGADATYAARAKVTALHKLENPESGKLVIEAGADPNAKNSSGDTPLHEAAFRGRTEMAKVLLSHGADANAPDKGGSTPLHEIAAKLKRGDIMKMLLAAGADANAFDNQGNTPLHLAAIQRGCSKAVKLFCENGSDPNAKNHKGETPFDVASSLSVEDILVNAGARH